MKRFFAVVMVVLLVLASISLDVKSVYAAQSAAPQAGNIIITNNLTGKSDTIYVFGVSPGTLVKVYTTSTGSKILTYGTVPNNKYELTFTVPQIGADGGSVYISVIERGNTESSRTKVDFEGEPKSDPISADAVSVTNNAQKSDVIYISGLNPRDTVKIYSAPSGGKLLTSKTVSASASDLTLTVNQVGSAAGSIYVSVTGRGYIESNRTKVDFEAEPASTPLDPDDITINNNAKKADTIYIGSLNAGDVVKVYNAASGGKLLGSKTVASNSYDATISVSQLGVSAGYIYITVTSSDCAESIRVPVQYAAELASDKPLAEFITVMNNSGKADIVNVSGLSPNDLVKVYNSPIKGSLLGSATVASTDSEVTVSIPQLGTTGGSIYVAITSPGKTESLRVQANYAPETRSGIISASNITVTNNVGKPDTISVSGLNESDLVKVYDAYTGGRLLGSAVVARAASDATVSVNQLGIDSGTVYVSVTSSGRLESIRMAVSYLGESKSSAPDTNAVTVSNNAGTSDTIYVTGLPAGTIVKVYSAATSGYQLGSATVAAAKTDATITIPQLGSTAGSVYVSITQPGAQESSRTKVDYSAEGTSAAPNVNNISISNNVGKADTIYVSNLTPGDIVRIYNAASQGAIIGNGVVSGTATDILLSIPQLGSGAGNIYVTVTNPGNAESARTPAPYRAESVYEGVDPSNITVTNNAGKADTVYFTRLSAGDVVKVYDSNAGGTLLGSAVVASGSTDTTVSIPQLGKGSGSVYVSISSTDKSESSRIEVSYTAEASTQELDSSQISVINNITGTPDTIYVAGLNPDDIIKAYSAAAQGVLLGTATVPSNGISATITVGQLGTAAGSVYVSVTSSGKLESQRTKADYAGEGKTSAPESRSITINNNSGAPDTVRVTGLVAEDTVKVYTQPSGGSLLGSSAVSTYGSEATVSIVQLGTGAGKVYVSVTSKNKIESERVEASYEAEPVTAPVNSSSITVTNNAGTADTVKVVGLTPGDTVKVYTLSLGGNLLGSAAVEASRTEAIVEIPQIGSLEGTLYVSVTSVNKAESSRTSVSYSGEAQSGAPDTGRVSIENNYGIPSTVTVGGLKDNDVVSIYSASAGGSLLGKGTVAVYSSEVSVPVSQLSDTGGSVYISVTSPGKLESTRTEVQYEAKPSSTPLSESNVEIYNNVGLADEVVVIGIAANSVIKVYGQASGGTPLGNATAPADGSQAVVYITQLGTSSGVVYITVTTPGRTESSRAAINYTAEATSEPLQEGNVKILNNSGVADTITVTGLLPYDTVKIYNGATGGTRLASVTADPNTLTATANIPQLGTGSGSVYVTVTNYGRSESTRTRIHYEAESVAPLSSKITIINNAGLPDTITVAGLEESDIVKVYDGATGGNLLATAIVPAGTNKVTLSVPQLTTSAGKVFISVTNFGRAESSLTRASYIAETSTTAPYIGDIYIVNNVAIDDTITVYNLTAGDVVKVYDKAAGGSLLGYSSAGNNKTEATVLIDDLGSTSGIVYISVTTKGKSESARTEASYVAESRSTAPYSGNIHVTNNASLSDTVLVTGLAAGDRVKVYNSSSGGELLGSATVATGSTQVKITIKQLGEEAGSVFVSLTSKGKTESKRTEAEYVSEQTTNQPFTGYIKVSNNKAGTPDTITVSGLAEGDVINVYSAAAGGSLLGTAVVNSGSTSGTVSLTQLSTTAGSVYVTVTSPGKYESERTKADYAAE